MITNTKEKQNPNTQWRGAMASQTANFLSYKQEKQEWLQRTEAGMGRTQIWTATNTSLSKTFSLIQHIWHLTLKKTLNWSGMNEKYRKVFKCFLWIW